MERNEIPLKHKALPLCELSAADADNAIKVLVRASGIDIRPLKSCLVEAGGAIWNEKNQDGNVAMRRMGHDKWGIGKIVLRYCDNYIKRVYTFPWYERFECYIEQILGILGIPKSRMIRCLFAAMPPGATIPVHHDTGYWVSKSHRIHVPISTSPLVDFQVGISEDNMIRVPFEEASIIELNNASKHKVYNGWSERRIHLIFDYVDKGYPLEHMTLGPGTILNVTRSSIDLDSDKGSRPIPSFIVIGAQKAGTTSIYEYLTEHPLVVPARRKETHFFDWRWVPKNPVAEYRKYFYTRQLQAVPSIMTGEATPSYILGGSQLIERVKNVVGTVKLIVMLRNPVDRAYSQFKMSKDEVGTPAQLRNRGFTKLHGKDMKTVVEEELSELKQWGVHAEMEASEFNQGYLKSKLKHKHGGHIFLGRGLYALQLELWLEAFPREDILILSLDEIMKSESRLDEAVESAYKFLGLPEHKLKDKSKRNSRQYPPMDPSTRDMLSAFFRPYNERLYRLIGRDLRWDS